MRCPCAMLMLPPCPQAVNESHTPLPSGFSSLSQEITFFAREQARACRIPSMDGLSPSVPPTAPPPPTTNAPTIAAIMGADSEKRRQLQLQQQQLQEQHSPAGSPESTRPPTGRRAPFIASPAPSAAFSMSPASRLSVGKENRRQLSSHTEFSPAGTPESEALVLLRGGGGAFSRSGDRDSTSYNSGAAIRAAIMSGGAKNSVGELTCPPTVLHVTASPL